MTSSAVAGETIEHTLHGLVTVRMVSAPPGIRNKVRRHFGSATDVPVEDPDIRITFQDELAPSGRLRFLGLNEAAYDEEHFYLLDNLGHRIRIDFRDMGERCVISCERGVTSLGFLLQVAGLRLLRKGHVLLHSSSFVHRDKGLLVAGWQKGGKSEMLLAFMAAGARYVSDEWTIVSGSGPTELYGVPGVLKIWDWHLRYLPEYWKRLPAFDRRRLAFFGLYQRLYRAVPHKKAPRGSVRSALRQLSLDGGASLLRQARVSPERLFADSLWKGAAPLDNVFLATVGTGGTALLALDARDVAQRMVASQAYERRQLFAAYDHFRFAFPDRRSEFLEHAHEQELRLLSQAFADKDAYEIVHPYPVPLDELSRAVETHLAGALR